MVAMDVDVGIGLPAITGPLGLVTIGPFNFETGRTNLAPGDTAFAPLVLGWNAGNFHWNVGVFGFAPTGDYSTRQLANTSLNHWAVMNRIAATYFDPKTGWQVNGAAIYTVNWEYPATDYETGNILNLEGVIAKNFGRWGVGVTGYAMIQTPGMAPPLPPPGEAEASQGKQEGKQKKAKREPQPGGPEGSPAVPPGMVRSSVPVAACRIDP
jgi:hypothetical protein